MTYDFEDPAAEFVLAVERIFGEHPRVLDGSRAVLVGDVKLQLEAGERELWLIETHGPLEHRVAMVQVRDDVEKALRQPAREAIQQRADAATFERRALAVEKERAIAENELANRIELAKREEQLVGQSAVNDRKKAESRAEEMLVAAGEKRSEAQRLNEQADELEQLGERALSHAERHGTVAEQTEQDL